MEYFVALIIFILLFSCLSKSSGNSQGGYQPKGPNLDRNNQPGRKNEK